MKRLGLIVLTAALAVCLTACGGISKSVDLKYGETYKIEDEKLEGKENLTWESDDSGIVSVSDDGTVTANAPGKAKVSIKEGEKSIGTYTFDVTTVPIEQIIFAADSIEVPNKTGNNVNKYTLLPKDASDYGITWTSADESVAVVNNNGEVETKSEGKTVIIATTENGVSAQYSIEVKPMSVWQQLTADEKSFVNDILPYMNNFKNPESVRFTDVRGYALLGTGANSQWTFTVSAQNGFGGNTVSSYMLWGSVFMEINELSGTQYRANLITQANLDINARAAGRFHPNFLGRAGKSRPCRCPTDMIYLRCKSFPVQRVTQKGARLMVHHLVIGIIFLFWGVADVLRLELPGVLARRLEASSEEARRLWQRLLGVLELIVGGGQLLFYFFSDNQTVTNIILAVMILAAVCILGPYYHWRKQEKENTQE